MLTLTRETYNCTGWAGYTQISTYEERKCRTRTCSTRVLIPLWHLATSINNRLVKTASPREGSVMMPRIKGVEPLSFGRQPNIITVILNRHKVAVFRGLYSLSDYRILLPNLNGSLLFIVAYFSRLSGGNSRGRTYNRSVMG